MTDINAYSFQLFVREAVKTFDSHEQLKVIDRYLNANWEYSVLLKINVKMFYNWVIYNKICL